jgi:hypothetical protein
VVDEGSNKGGRGEVVDEEEVVAGATSREIYQVRDGDGVRAAI